MSPLSDCPSTDPSLRSLPINPQLPLLYLDLSLISLPYCDSLAAVAIILQEVFLTILISIRIICSLTVHFMGFDKGLP